MCVVQRCECRNHAGVADSNRSRFTACAADAAQDQSDRQRAEGGHQHRGGAGDEDRFAEEQVGDHLNVDRQVLVVAVHIQEVGREKVTVEVAEAVANEVGGQDGLDRLIGEEPDREIRQPDQTDGQIDPQRQQEQRVLQPSGPGQEAACVIDRPADRS
jgi:hypothetical protein